MIATAIRYWRPYMAACTALAGTLSIGYAFFWIPLHEWGGWLICFGLTGVAAYAVIKSRAFVQTGSLKPIDKVATFAIGIISTVLITILFCFGFAVVWLTLWSIVKPVPASDGPVEVKLARSYWTGKLK